MSCRVLSSFYRIFYNTYQHRSLTTYFNRNVNNYFSISHPKINSYVKYSTEEHSTVTYEEVENVCKKKDTNILLIDVREPEELVETGVLPSSINIPLGNLEDVLKNMSNEEFLKVYGREKPNKNSDIIFSCKMGKRSATACNISQQLGYKNVKNYLGGWMDWEERKK